MSIWLLLVLRYDNNDLEGLLVTKGQPKPIKEMMRENLSVPQIGWNPLEKALLDKGGVIL